MSKNQQEQLQQNLVKIFENANLYDKDMTPTEDLVVCIVCRQTEDKHLQRHHEQDDEEEPESDSTSKGNFCCMSARNHDDPCGTCWESAVAKPTDYCGESEAQCEKCNKTW